MTTFRGRVFSFTERFCRSSEATFSILTAMLSVVLVGLTGFAVDLGAIVFWQTRLQSATDAAALAATFDFDRSESIGQLALQSNGAHDAVIDDTTTGNYTEDPSIAADDRFVGAAQGNAVRLATHLDVPIRFVRVFTQSPTFRVDASATAYTLPLAGIAIGTGAADSSAAQLNSYLEALTATQYNLTAAERDALETSRISIFRLLDQMAALTGSQSDAMETVLASQVNLPTLASAAAAALSAQSPNPDATTATAIAAFDKLTQGSGSPAVTVSEFLALLAHQKRIARDLVAKRNDAIAVPALSLLLGYFQASRQDALVNLNQPVSIPGVANIAIEAVLSKSALGGGAPSLTMVGPAGSSATSSQGRIRLTISLLQAIQINLGIIHLTLTPTIPIIADIGYGTATITDIACGPDILETTDISVSAQSGALRLYIGNVNNNQLSDLTTPLTPLPATVISTPLVSLTAQSQTEIAQSGTQTLHFGWDDITQGTVKSTDGVGSLGTALSDLNNNLAVAIAQAPVGTGALISNALRTQIATVLTALEPELQTILASMGLRAGYLEARASGARCGIPVLAH